MHSDGVNAIVFATEVALEVRKHFHETVKTLSDRYGLRDGVAAIITLAAIQSITDIHTADLSLAGQEIVFRSAKRMFERFAERGKIEELTAGFWQNFDNIPEAIERFSEIEDEDLPS